MVVDKYLKGNIAAKETLEESGRHLAAIAEELRHILGMGILEISGGLYRTPAGTVILEQANKALKARGIPITIASSSPQIR